MSDRLGNKSAKVCQMRRAGHSNKQADKVLDLGSMQITYRIIYARRKTLSITVQENAVLLIKAPVMMTGKEIMNFLLSKKDWIQEQIKKVKKAQKNKIQLNDKEKQAYLDRACVVVPERVEHFAAIMGVHYNRICLKEQKTRWGSCSSLHNLNFNWRLILMPPRILDYVVVHELSHLIELNHSPQFWAVVERYYPEYEEAKQWLKDNGGRYC